MIATMRRKQRKPAGKYNDPRESFHLPVALQLALECAAFLPEMPTNKSAVLRACLEKAMRAEGWFPLTDDNLRRLLQLADVEELSPNARTYLQGRRLLPADA